jgi:voltage-gated potassium channel
VTRPARAERPDFARRQSELRRGRPLLSGHPSPWWAGWRLAVALLAVIVAGGTFGYSLIEGWGLWDAFYMTVISVTTVGYREVHPLSRAGQVFTAAFVTVGVATVLYTFSFLMSHVIEGDLQDRWVRRRRKRMLDDLTHHFIICGFGRIGQIVAREFSRQGVPFVIVERDAARMQQAIDAGYLAVEADASSEEVLKRIGIERARGFIAAVSTDAENVYAVLTARLLRKDLYIIGRAETEDAQAKLVRAGADRVLSPYHIGGLQLAQTALRPAVVDFVQLATSSDNLDLNIEQVQIADGAPLSGRTIVEANLRQRFGVIVVGIQRASGEMEFNPPPESVMKVGDFLVALGQAKNLRELEVAAGKPAQVTR